MDTQKFIGDSTSERQEWHLDYVDFLTHGDVSHIAQVEQLDKMRSLLEVLAEYSGKLTIHSNLASVLELNCLVKTPKLHFLDSGQLASLRGNSLERLDIGRTEFGPLLESFVFSELLKLSNWTSEQYSFSHFRDKQGNEVDVVMEDRRGRVIGVEVKAEATVSSRDFSGLRRLATACGDRFVTRLVLYDYDQILPFGDRMWAAPVSALWS